MDAIELRILHDGEPSRVVRIRCERAEFLEQDTHPSSAPLNALPPEEQAFVIAFVRSHGNIRKMERLFDISYPTVKKRLNAIVERLDDQFRAPDDDARSDVLRRLELGRITPAEALAELDRLGTANP